MPTYDYQCDKCGHAFERVQRITEDPVKTCPECKARKVKRLLSAPNFILKGGGWYADGYGSSKGGGSGKGDGDDSGGGGNAKSGGKSDSGGSKSDAKSDTKSSGKSSGTKASGNANKSAA